MYRWTKPIACLCFRVGVLSVPMCVSRRNIYICLVMSFVSNLASKNLISNSAVFASWIGMQKNQEVNYCFHSNVLLTEWWCKLLNCVWSVWSFRSLLEGILSRYIVTRLYWKRLQSGEECPLCSLNLFALKVSFVAKEIKWWLWYRADSSNDSYSQNKPNLVKLLRMM